MAQLHDLSLPRRVRARPRLFSRGYPFSPARARLRANPLCSQPRQKRVVANPAPAWRRPTPCPSVAFLAHMWRQETMQVSADVGSKRHVTWSRGVREPAGIARCGVREQGGVARCGVKTWRHLPTWRQGATWRQEATWRRQMWRQNVASLAHVASGGGVDRCGVKTWRHLPSRRGGVARWWRQSVASLAHVASGSQVASLELYQGSRQWLQLASQDVASGRGVARSRGIREPRGVAGGGDKTWRQAP